MNEEKPDWRIGRKIKPQLFVHPWVGRLHVIVKVFPDGTCGIEDKNGVLGIVPLSHMTTSQWERYALILVRASDWITA